MLDEVATYAYNNGIVLCQQKPMRCNYRVTLIFATLCRRSLLHVEVHFDEQLSDIVEVAAYSLTQLACKLIISDAAS